MNKEKKYAGVDISKDYLDIAVVGFTDKWRFGNNQTGIKKAIREFRKKSPIMVVFESTWGMEIDLWLALNEAGIDAQVIGQFGQAIKPKPQVVPDTQELKELAARRKQIAEMISAENCRVKAARQNTIKTDIRTNIDWLEKRHER